MEYFDYLIPKRNIQRLLEARHVSQKDLGDIIGMSQPNISKALNLKEKKSFTIEQIYNIAKYFNVSVDSLLGSPASSSEKIEPIVILDYLTELLSKDLLRAKKIEVNETVYKEYFDECSYEFRPQDEKVVYPAFFFPSFSRSTDYEYKNFSDEDLFYEFNSSGNATRYTRLNKILLDFIGIIRLYKNGEISQEAFEMILSDYKNKLAK